jgi:hypothetical protein
MFGISKVKCASSIAAGDFIKAYEGASTTTFAGFVVASAIQGATNAAVIASTASQLLILGRALEDGSTNTVISAFINPTPLLGTF